MKNKKLVKKVQVDFKLVEQFRQSLEALKKGKIRKVA